MANDAGGIGGRPPGGSGGNRAFRGPSPGRGRQKASAQDRGANGASGSPASSDGQAGTARQGAKAAQLATSARAFAAAQAQDGTLAPGNATAGNSARFLHNPQANAAADLQRVATQPTLDPLVLPAPTAQAITPTQAGRLLSRLAILRGSVALGGVGGAAAATAAATAPDSGEDAGANKADAANAAAPATGDVAAQGTQTAPTPLFSPDVLRYAKNELGLSPKAYRALVALNSGQPPPGPLSGADARAPGTSQNGGDGPSGADIAPVAAATAAAPGGVRTVTTSTPGTDADASSTAPQTGAAASNITADGSIDFTTATVPGQGSAVPQRITQTLTVPTADGKGMTLTTHYTKYQGYVGWTAFAALVSRDQLEAMMTLALLRQVELNYANRSQNLLNQVELLRTQNRIQFEQNNTLADAMFAPLSARHAFVEGRSRVLRNTNANTSNFEQEYNMKLEANAGGAVTLGEQAVLLQKAPKQPVDDEALRRVGAAGHVGDAVLASRPVVQADGSIKQVPLRRTVLTPEEGAALTGDLGSRYRDNERKLRQEEQSDLGARHGRFAAAAKQMQDARDDSRTAANAVRQSDPAKAAAYDALAEGFDSRRRAFDLAAAGTGYNAAALTAVRANLAQYRDSIKMGLSDLTKLTTKRDEVEAQLQAQRNAAGPGTAEKVAALEARALKLNVAVENTQFRIIGMKNAVALCTQIEAVGTRRRYVSGGKALVERHDALAKTLKEAPRTDPAAQAAARKAYADFTQTFTGDVVRRLRLSQMFHEAFGGKDNPAQRWLSVLANPQSSEQDRLAARDELHKRLRDAFPGQAGDPLLAPGYAELTKQGVTKPGMDDHVRQRMAWDTESRGDGHLSPNDMLQAERRFWNRHDDLAGANVGDMNHVRRLLDRVTSRLSGSKKASDPYKVSAQQAAPYPTAGAQGSATGNGDNNPLRSPITNFVAAKGVNMNDPQARRAYLDGHVNDARAWADTYHDPLMNFLEQKLSLVAQMRQAEAQLDQTTANLAEGAAGELQGAFDEARNEFFAAMDSERSATLGLVNQLRSVYRVD